ncbi:MAG: hypothetical protein KF826_00670 [Xanthobacteraceae bacterium]|nr:hypothetical protein [Xanthobacteraceae bacterium]MBX3550620.1 hypothetical protein [Xanthobacteraceae bacterium]MCW5677825.1 hypothetical protein [Xanthobacteraceae bacterium]
MLGKSLAILVVSPHEASGCTLIARLFAEFFRLSGDAPILFDTDALKPKLSLYFPEAELADLSKTKGQMRLFDTLPLRAHEPKIVDVTWRSFQTFFEQMRDIDLVAEARANNVEPVVVYIPHYTADDFERGYRIREHFGCEFVLAENAFLGPAPQALHSVNSYWALKAHPVHMAISLLDEMSMNLLEDTRVSMAEFLKASAPGSMPVTGEKTQLPLAYLSLDARSKIRAWLRPSLREVQRTVQLIQARLNTPISVPQSF